MKLLKYVTIVAIVIVLALFLWVFSPCFSMCAGAEDVSIKDLIAAPAKYDGKRVRVVGYALVQFEATALFISESDMSNGITRNALWLIFPFEEMQDGITYRSLVDGFRYLRCRILNKRYVCVEGVFDKAKRGHMGLFSGGIRNIRQFHLQC